MTENPQEEVTHTSAARKFPLWGTVLAFTILAVFLVMIGLGLQRTQQGPIRIGQGVPPITLTTFGGEEISTTAMQGKIIVINFWASWCKPCEGEAADMEAVWKEYAPGGKVVFLGVDYVDTEPAARKYLDTFAISYPNGPDLGTRISQTFRITGVPETYFIDQNGKLVYAQKGPFGSQAEIKAIIDPLLQQN